VLIFNLILIEWLSVYVSWVASPFSTCGRDSKVPLCQVYFDRRPTERLNGFADRAIGLAFPSSGFLVRPSLFNQHPFLPASLTCKEIKNQPLLRCRHLEHLPIMNCELIGIDVTLTLNNGVMDTIIVAMDVSLEH